MLGCSCPARKAAEHGSALPGVVPYPACLVMPWMAGASNEERPPRAAILLFAADRVAARCGGSGPVAAVPIPGRAEPCSAALAPRERQPSMARLYLALCRIPTCLVMPWMAGANNEDRPPRAAVLLFAAGRVAARCGGSGPVAAARIPGRAEPCSAAPAPRERQPSMARLYLALCRIPACLLYAVDGRRQQRRPTAACGRSLVRGGSGRGAMRRIGSGRGSAHPW